MIYNSVDEAIEAIKCLYKSDDKPVYFRGQSQDWNIKSSLWRIEDNKLRTEKVNATYRFVNWLKNSHLLNYTKDDSNMNLSYWAVAQHYGFKTDLIDFTTDINVARFFASAQFKKENKEKPGIIIVLRHSDVLKYSSIIKYLIDTNSIKEPSIIEILRKNNYSPFFHLESGGVSRIVNQKGLFFWDVHNIGSMLLNINNMDNKKYYFKHNDIDLSKEESLYIYPAANEVEHEIEKIRGFEYGWDFFNNEIFKEILVSVDLEDEYNKDQLLDENEWDIPNSWNNINFDYIPKPNFIIKCQTINMKEYNNLLSDFNELRKLVSN
ncbi:MAG: FRG domain-containing protein, partial [Clostridia bacterium]|nr:FRG domain-containing protein [Clostridia bacterium]